MHRAMRRLVLVSKQRAATNLRICKIVLAACVFGMALLAGTRSAAVLTRRIVAALVAYLELLAIVSAMSVLWCVARIGRMKLGARLLYRGAFHVGGRQHGSVIGHPFPRTAMTIHLVETRTHSAQKMRIVAARFAAALVTRRPLPVSV